MVVENLAKVEKKICAACERAGRKREEVTLIAVSKTKPVSMIESCSREEPGTLEKIRCRSFAINTSSCRRISAGTLSVICSATR